VEGCSTGTGLKGYLAYAEAIHLGLEMLPLKTSVYSTEATMACLVNNIIAPYFEKTKKELGLPKELSGKSTVAQFTDLTSFELGRRHTTQQLSPSLHIVKEVDVKLDTTVG
jgi:hypothetical protein